MVGTGSQLMSTMSSTHFVLKRLKAGVKETSTAAIDLITECKFLSSLDHPNIVSLRGTIGEAGDEGLGLILERLSTTLEEKIETEWAVQSTSSRRRFRLRWNQRRISAGKQMTPEAFDSDRLAVMYEVSKAMTYLHENK